MGLYINPKDGSKESWLSQNAREVTLPEFTFKTGTGEVPLVLVDNGPFTACAVAYSEREMVEFTNPDDYRQRKYFYAKYEAVKEVTNGGSGYDITPFAQK